MKVLICGLLMAGISAMFDRTTTTTQQRCATSNGEAQVMVIRHNADGEAEPMVIQAAGDPATGFAFTHADGALAAVGEGEGNVIVATVNVADTDDGAAPQRHKVVQVMRRGSEGPDAGNRGWLGVSIGRVPESVAAQLDAAADGVMVLNVVEGSPADRGGLKAHDIIVTVGGEAVEGDVARTTQLISDRKPGDAVQVSILRDGQAQTLTLTLGARSEMGAAAWKFRLPPGEVEESIHTHGRMLQKDANGNWIMKDLGELGDLSNLPAQIQAMVPQGGNKTVQITVNNGEKNVAVSAVRDGTSIAIEQSGDGPITVTRTDANGAATTATYATRDELAAKDAEAAELFGDTDQTFVMQLDGDGAVGGNLNFDFDFDLDTEDLHEHLMQWHEQMQQGLGQAGESYREAMEEIHAAIERIKQEHGIDGNAFGFMFGHGPGAAAPGTPPVVPDPPRFRWFGQARQSFEVRPDGTIEAKIRRGDTEVVELFTNEADLQQRDAELYQKFIDTRKAEH